MAETTVSPSSEPSEQSAGNDLADPSTIEAEDLLKMILDEDRLAILGLTAVRPCTVRELVAALPGKRTPPAKHVAQLVAAGLLAQADDESYALNVHQLQLWKRTLFARAAQPVPESSDEQILATFVRGGKMIQYPAQHSKREVVLRWLASRFEPGRAYTEREVNEMLVGHSEDHATLRRYLVDWVFLVRQDGVYRRAQDTMTPEVSTTDAQS